MPESPNGSKQNSHLLWIGFMTFITLFLTVAGLVNFYLYHRTVRLLEIDSRKVLWALRIAAIMLTISYPTARLIVRENLNALTKVWYWIACLWMGFAFFWCGFNVAAQIAGAILNYAGVVSKHAFGRPAFFVTLAGAAAMCVYAYGIARYGTQITQIEVPVKNLPPRLEGFKIAQISDTHFGIVVGENWTREIVDCVNSLEPDLIVSTGDLIDENPEDLPEIFAQLKRLKAKYGVYAVTGNHEFYNHPNRIVKYCAEIGVKYLRNERAVVADDILLYGIDDATTRHRSGNVDAFGKNIDPEAKAKPAILLFHRPMKFERAESLGIDLMLSGHTHNGQIWPMKYMVRRVHPHLHGLYKSGGASLYVSAGTGVWAVPMRFSSRPEIVVIKLTLKK